MARRVERLPLGAGTPGTRREILVHRFGMPGARPKAYFQAAPHADEIPAILVAHHLIRRLAGAGEAIAWLIDPTAEDPSEGRRAIRADTDGLVLSRRDRRYMLPGTKLAKIVGTETLPERRGRNLLGD